METVAAIATAERGPLLAVARRVVRSEEDAADALQDGLLSAIRASAAFAARARLGTWLHRIVANAALMKLRGRRRRPEDPIADLLPAFLEDGRHAAPIGAWHVSAETAVERAEVRALVRRAIDGLPAAYRQVLLLRDIEELDTAESARRLGISPEAVKTRLHRARQALRTLLAPHFERPEWRGGIAPGIVPCKT